MGLFRFLFDFFFLFLSFLSPSRAGFGQFGGPRGMIAKFNLVAGQVGSIGWTISIIGMQDRHGGFYIYDNFIMTEILTQILLELICG